MFESWAARFGTPLYIYDAGEVARRAAELSGVLPGSSRLLYSFKANPLPGLAAETRRSGCEADLTSPGEIEAAREAGFDLRRALYGGPGKRVAELSGALEAGIRRFSVESESDLHALAAAAGERDAEVEALLRINPAKPPKAKLAMAGVASQFGFEEEELLARGRELLRGLPRRVRVVGVHIYWGTQVGDAGALAACFRETVAVAESVGGALGFPLEILNLGGGFPWPYAKEGRGPDLSPLREELENLRERCGAAREARWWFESGRHLVASSGTLAARVVEVKASKEGRLFVVLDTGIHHLGGMTGLGRIPRFAIDLETPPARAGAEEIVCDVVGQLCTPLDCIGKRIAMPRPEPGDLVAIPNVGAYGPTASVLGFLSRPAPVEMVHREGRFLTAHRLRGGHERLF